MQLDSRIIVAAAVVFATLVAAWMFRYELTFGGNHRNRFTGEVCHYSQECWFTSRN